MVYLLFFVSLAKPKLGELLSFNGKKKTINVAELVGTKFTELGIFLLNDETGAIVEAMENECNKNAKKINMAIFRKWLQGKEGAQPVAWSTLIYVLREISLGILADDIEGGLM